MQYRCNIEALEMIYKHIASVLYSYLTFTDRVGGGVVGEMGNKAISAFNSVEFEVEAALGNSLTLEKPTY